MSKAQIAIISSATVAVLSIATAVVYGIRIHKIRENEKFHRRDAIYGNTLHAMENTINSNRNIDYSWKPVHRTDEYNSHFGR